MKTILAILCLVSISMAARAESNNEAWPSFTTTVQELKWLCFKAGQQAQQGNNVNSAPDACTSLENNNDSMLGVARESGALCFQAGRKSVLLKSAYETALKNRDQETANKITGLISDLESKCSASTSAQ